MRIGDFEICDHGIEHSQYFQGCGTAFTNYADCVTGIGENFAEAIDDCLEQIAQAGFDTDGMEGRIMADLSADSLPTEPSVEHDEDSDSPSYHVSIRFNEG